MQSSVEFHLLPLDSNQRHYDALSEVLTARPCAYVFRPCACFPLQQHENPSNIQSHLYKAVHLKEVSDIRCFKCGPQKYSIQTKMVIFLYNLYTWSFLYFVCIQNICLPNMVFALDHSNSNKEVMVK